MNAPLVLVELPILIKSVAEFKSQAAYQRQQDITNISSQKPRTTQMIGKILQKQEVK